MRTTKPRRRRARGGARHARPGSRSAAASSRPFEPKSRDVVAEAHGRSEKATSMLVWTSTGSALMRPRMRSALGGGTAAACSQ